MKFEEIDGLSVQELKNKKSALRLQVFQAQMKNSVGQLANPMEIRALRRDIARLNTAMTSKRRSGVKG